MTRLLSLCAFGLLCAILSEVVVPLSPNLKGALTLAGGIVFLTVFIGYLFPSFRYLVTLTATSRFSSLFQLLFKALGISFLVSVCASFCRDLGQDSVAEKLELCGKAAILSLSLPVLETVLEVMGGMMP